MSGFNPHTHEGVRPDLCALPCCGLNVSIHAPARGATRLGNQLRLIIDVSIHAPARGATLWPPMMIPTESFNPRTREGCDRGHTGLTIINQVSIHAPARGATSSLLSSCLRCLFQSTHPRGVRQRLAVDRGRAVRFNPRTREGCDGTCWRSPTPAGCFNPRTREGCDAYELFQVRPFCVSIHAPARGATLQVR